VAEPGPAGRWRAGNALAPMTLAAFGGAATVLAYAPFGWWPLAPIGLTLLFWLWRDVGPRRAFVLGWAWGFGLYAFGLFWVRISIAVYGGAPLALAVSAALALAAAMAVFHGAAGALTAWLVRTPDWRRLVFAAPAAWTLTEWLREWAFTGFPWLQIGYSQIDSPLAGLAPLSGVLGVTLGLAFIVGWLAALADPRTPRMLAASLVLLVFGAGMLRGETWTRPAGEPFRAALLQGNISQDEKWRPGNLIPTIDHYMDLTRKYGDGADLIVWPEAAVPATADELEDLLLQPLQAFAGQEGQVILQGILFHEEPGERYYTSLLALDGGRDRYDKRHLVPFGEYFPLGHLWKDTLRGLATVGEDFTPGEAAQPLVHAGRWDIGVSICYEILFGEEIREALPQARFLVNVSNDGWFGDSLGPHQHLEIARMRALETGRYLLRATNTGITALIDDTGAIVDRLPQFEHGGLVVDVEPREGVTPYARWGNWPAITLGILLAVWGRYGAVKRKERPRMNRNERR